MGHEMNVVVVNLQSENSKLSLSVCWLDAHNHNIRLVSHPVGLGRYRHEKRICEQGGATKENRTNKQLPGVRRVYLFVRFFSLFNFIIRTSTFLCYQTHFLYGVVVAMSLTAPVQGKEKGLHVLLSNSQTGPYWKTTAYNLFSLASVQ